MWTVQEAKAKLSQVLKRARAEKRRSSARRTLRRYFAGRVQATDSRRQQEPHLGRWLVENLRGPRRDRVAVARRRSSESRSPIGQTRTFVANEARATMLDTNVLSELAAARRRAKVRAFVVTLDNPLVSRLSFMSLPTASKCCRRARNAPG